MTKIVDLPFETVQTILNTPHKPIQLCKFVDEQHGELTSNSGLRKILSFSYVTLLVPASSNAKYDIIMCWDEDLNPERRCVYLGHWNDGVVA